MGFFGEHGVMKGELAFQMDFDDCVCLAVGVARLDLLWSTDQNGEVNVNPILKKFCLTL